MGADGRLVKQTESWQATLADVSNYLVAFIYERAKLQGVEDTKRVKPGEWRPYQPKSMYQVYK